MARISITSALGVATLALVDAYISAETDAQLSTNNAHSARAALMISIDDYVVAGGTISSLVAEIKSRAEASRVGEWLPKSNQMVTVWQLTGRVLKIGGDFGYMENQWGESINVTSDEIRACINAMYNDKSKSGEMRELIGAAESGTGAALFASLVDLRNKVTRAPKKSAEDKGDDAPESDESAESLAERIMAAAEMVEVATAAMAEWDDDTRAAFLMLAQAVTAGIKAAAPKAA